VVNILKGKTTVAKVARQFDLKSSEAESAWERVLAQGEKFWNRVMDGDSQSL